MRFAVLISLCTLSQAIPQATRCKHGEKKQAGGFKAVLLADTNRDGKVDDSDHRAGKEKWMAESGALFLANIADTDGRCSSQITGKCASSLGDLFRKNPVSIPMPEAFDGNAEIDQLQNSPNPEDQQRGDALWEAGFEAFNQRMREWEWAKGDGALIERCHDATDDVLRNPALLAPLRTVPNPEISTVAKGSIIVSREAAAKVRIFHNKAGKWVYVGPDYTFSAEDVKAGLQLGVDGRDVRRPEGWDGKALVTFTVQDGDKTANDSVALRVAPVVTHHHGQRVTKLFSSLNAKREHSKTFNQELQAVSDSMGIPVHVFNTTDCAKDSNGADIWTQDFFEPGYTSIPGPNGPVGLRIMIRSSEGSRDVGRKLFQELRSDSVGVVQNIRSIIDSGDVESTGNLEAIPPYTHNGKTYPVGRAIMGSQEERPLMMSFLEAQEVQEPLELDTSWLSVGHVDEFLQFLPVKSSERKWVMVVNDPEAGLELLRGAQRAGHGAVKAVSRPARPSDPVGGKTCHPLNTVDQVLNKTGFADYQSSTAQAINKNIDLLKRETGITDAEIIRLPTIYYPKSRELPHWERCEEKEKKEAGAGADSLGGPDKAPVSADGASPAAQLQRRETHRFSSLWPAIINGVVLNDGKVLAPNPWGPVVDGKDIFVEAANAAYAKASFTVEYMDDWFSHHASVGDVHCATNTLREITGQWW